MARSKKVHRSIGLMIDMTFKNEAEMMAFFNFFRITMRNIQSLVESQGNRLGYFMDSTDPADPNSNS